MNKPNGANCKIRYFSDSPRATSEVFISFGEYDEENDTDAHGRPDDTIFYYVDDEAELITLMDKNNGGDFIVLRYELETEV